MRTMCFGSRKGQVVKSLLTFIMAVGMIIGLPGSALAETPGTNGPIDAVIQAQAEQVQDENGVVFRPDLNIWDNSSLSEYGRQLMKLVSEAYAEESPSCTATIDSMELAGAGLRLPRNEAQAIIDEVYLFLEDNLCGNYEASPLAWASYTYDTSGRLQEIKIMIPPTLNQWCRDINKRYRETLNSVGGIVTGEMGVTEQDTERDALTKINDWICRNITYDLDYRDKTVTACIADRRAVCCQYSQIFKFCCDFCDIQCDVESGFSNTGGGHAWNKVTLDGQDYYIDSTWNKDTNNRYFMLSKYEFGEKHVWRSEVTTQDDQEAQAGPGDAPER